MILAAALFAVAPQTTAAAVPEPDYEEVVITAKVGRVALVFDKGADGRLRNCRVFISSGVDQVDAEACGSLPDCITSTSGAEFCGDGLGGTAALKAVEPKPPAPTLGLGKLLKPETPKVPAVGPIVATKDEEDPNRLGKLPPPPKAESGTPAITFSGAQAVEEPR
ncbi:MAG: hypothetical protein CVT77_00850 [Alphaproteobacteria bacterium HGW-Alphaproteobacteria-16]|nr:MAG: hypothetical protein CVT77_00850 [Alphaproteobacteria bacterium HGW-Alphaproteobacteria-16]